METMTDRNLDRRTLERRYPMYANSAPSGTRPLISWGAVFAGVVTGIAVQVLLSALGMGIGGSVLNPTTQSNPMAGLGIGALVWLFVSQIVAYYASGWTAGRSSGMNGVIHGMVTWGFSMVLTTILLTSALGGALSGVSKVVGSIGQGNVSPAITNTVNNAIGGNQGGSNTGAANSGGGSIQSGASKGQVDSALNQAQGAIQNPQNQEQAAKGTAMAGFGAFVLLLASFGACLWGGSAGVKRSRLVVLKA
jgi:hypothetical protein